mgnify:CR=1 FL=1
MERERLIIVILPVKKWITLRLTNKGWKASSEKLKRGLYKYSEGFLIDAEFNGAANIAVKVATQLNLNLAGIGRAALTLPRRVDLFEVLSKSFGNIDLSKDSDTPRPLSSPSTGNPLWFALTL